VDEVVEVVLVVDDADVVELADVAVLTDEVVTVVLVTWAPAGVTRPIRPAATVRRRASTAKEWACSVRLTRSSLIPRSLVRPSPQKLR
jgi:hypothetical protein